LASPPSKVTLGDDVCTSRETPRATHASITFCVPWMLAAS
jgi:hypothetical protein